MPPKGQDFVRMALQKIPVKARCISLEPQDSNHIDELYLFGILQHIEKEPKSGVLVTLGTDAIVQAAEYFYRECVTNPALKDKTIVLTGAMVPLSCGAESDGMPNLRFALRQLEQGQMSRGVYVVLCDYQSPETKEGWSPRLYRFEPGQYEKFYDPDDGSRNRIRRVKQ